MSNRVPQVLRRCKLRASRLLSTSQASEERPPDPVYVNLQEVQQEAEATSSSPVTEPLPSSPLSDWETHTDADSGQPFYYNPETGQTTWDCPFDAPVEAVSPTTSPSPSLGEWSQYLDEASGQLFFYNSVTGQTSWEPPQAEDIFGSQEMQPGIMSYSLTDQRPPTPEADYPEPSPDELPDSFPEEDYSPISSPPLWHCEGQGWGCHHSQEGPYADVCASNTISVPSHHRSASSGSSHDGSPFSPRHNSITMFSAQQEEQWKTLDKAGVLHRTKTIDKGKRLRKNWSSSWTVLEGGILTFFKDSKHSSSSSSSVKHPSMPSTPEHTVDLRGAALAWAAKDKSSRKNVLELKTRDGSKYLIQHDSEMIINTWHNAIADSISRLPLELSPEDNNENGSDFGSKERLGSKDKEEEKKGSGFSHSASSLASDSDSSKVRHKLRKFLQRRPTLQSLRERGYIKDQVFGCPLQALCERERGTVPQFVQHCIRTVENRGLDIDGLYRISGNLATIQRLRYKVDHDERLDLEDGRWEDVHVITGALKLFFRELPEPLFPFSHFDKFIAAIKISDYTKRSCCLRDLVLSLPPTNHDTMQTLFQHLCRVIEFREQNRMSVQSIAIVFGPTLLKPAAEESNMAMHMVFQNQIVEQILTQYSYIFPES